jgi:hypothetical protein
MRNVFIITVILLLGCKATKQEVKCFEGDIICKFDYPSKGNTLDSIIYYLGDTMTITIKNDLFKIRYNGKAPFLSFDYFIFSGTRNDATIKLLGDSVLYSFDHKKMGDTAFSVIDDDSEQEEISGILCKKIQFLGNNGMKITYYYNEDSLKICSPAFPNINLQQGIGKILLLKKCFPIKCIMSINNDITTWNIVKIEHKSIDSTVLLNEAGFQ